MICKANMEQLPSVILLACELWKDYTAEELTREYEKVFESGKGAVFLLVEDNQPVGFAHCQLRYDYVLGTQTSPVGYLEGIYIKEKYRKNGHATELVKKCEEWAKSQGCSEFASDCELPNEISYQFHLNLGFKEVNRIICFAKPIEE